MSVRLVAVTFEAPDPGRTARFWARLLGRELHQTAWGELLPGEGGEIGLRFAPRRVARSGPGRMHLHLTSSSQDDQDRTVERALELGARHLDVGQLPEEEHVVLADPGDTEFCVIEPGNSFLAGCGFLAELACDGGREVGLFWSGALGWPLVWDQDEETAIQSPRGGTKIAWGGPPETPPLPQAAPRLDLATDGDLAREAERLSALGATDRRTESGGTIVLRDPDGNEFHLRGDDG